MIDYSAARLNMVEGQLRTNKVTNESVLAAFLAVPRERFVPPALAGIAYVDDDVPLGGGRVLLQPMVLARLLQLAAITPADRVIEIGAATGYATALVARLGAQVVAVECDAGLIATARTRLRELGTANVTLVEGPLERGHPAAAPYDVILIGGAVAVIPDEIARQLAEGGRLVTVLRSGDGMGQGMVMTRVEGILSRRPVFDAATALLPGFEPAPAFVF
ncbi:MAG TPA: protein-L-isoaspartate O-methyltransferase [Stellaceae bacterium]|nr:protein-L-isoaspartate O-methyltransferase [Stellaceae bacterium]